MRAVVTLAAALWLGTSGAVSMAENSRGARAGTGAKVYPNPARDIVHIVPGTNTPNSIIAPNEQLRVTVHNVTGRLVRKLHDGRINFGAGDHGEITWDGRMDSGHRVPSGFYYIRIVRNGQVSVVKVWYVR